MLESWKKPDDFSGLFVELGFLTILSVILIYLILGDDRPACSITSVADNVNEIRHRRADAKPDRHRRHLAIVYW